MARYSDHGKESLATRGTPVDLRRIDGGTYLGTFFARIVVLCERQCKAAGGFRKEQVAIAVIR
jgi:hypothetical protein